jgi:hypothetical protein
MPEITIPLSKGDKRSPKNLDYIDAMPVNMLTVMREIDGVPGFMRFFPGIEKKSDAPGMSRGVHFSTIKEDCYRVLGNKLFLGDKEVGDVSDSDRVSIAHSRTSVAVSNGSISIYQDDGVKTIKNWPDEIKKGFTKELKKSIHSTVLDTLKLDAATVSGRLTVNISPRSKAGKLGANLLLKEADWSSSKSQPAPTVGTPYIKNAQVVGIKSSGQSLTLKYDLYLNEGPVTNPYQPDTITGAGTSTRDKAKALKTLWRKADPELDAAVEALNMVKAYEDDPFGVNAIAINNAWTVLGGSGGAAIIKLINDNRGPDPDFDSSEITWAQTVDDFTIKGTSYNWGVTADICRLRGRYVWLQEGTDTFWCTSIEDETKIDKIDPASRAEYMPDDLRAIRAWKDFLVLFGGSTIEFVTLTGDANNLFRSSPGHTIETGIAGRFAVTDYAGSFAFVTSDANGVITISIMQQGSAVPISSRTINQILATYTQEQLAGIILESIAFDHHDLLICHLPDQTIVYDSTSQVWSRIKTGLNDDTHRGIDYCKVGNEITCGDKLQPVIGKLITDSCKQYDEQQEIELYTPILSAPNSMLYDLEITSGTGVASFATRLLISSTEDGVIYGNEKPLIINEPQRWLLRPIMRNVGRVRNRIGLKLRVVTDTPVALEKLKVRVE